MLIFTSFEIKTTTMMIMIIIIIIIIIIMIIIINHVRCRPCELSL